MFTRRLQSVGPMRCEGMLRIDSRYIIYLFYCESLSSLYIRGIISDTPAVDRGCCICLQWTGYAAYACSGQRMWHSPAVDRVCCIRLQLTGYAACACSRQGILHAPVVDKGCCMRLQWTGNAACLFYFSVDTR